MKNLTAYSLAASAFMIHEETDAQIIYENIDSDIELTTYEFYDLDFNHDGDIDISIRGYSSYDGWSSTYGMDVTYVHGYFYITGFDGVVNDPAFPLEEAALNLDNGFMIGSSASWNNNDPVKLNDFQIHFDDFIYGDDNWHDENMKLGVRFKIDGQVHFGWVRLSVKQQSKYSNDIPLLYIQDFAYNAAPNEPIEVKDYAASIATGLTILDAGEANQPSDLQINFNKAENENTVSSYRIFIRKCSYVDGWIPTVSDLNSLPEDRYAEVMTTGEDIEWHPGPGFKDINGDTLLINTAYKCVVLSKADGVIATEDNVSIKSWNEYYSTRGASYPGSVWLTDHQENCDVGDFTVNFSVPSQIYSSGGYRVFISPIGTEVIETLLSMDSSFYTYVPVFDAADYSVEIPSWKQVPYDGIPLPFHTYFAYVVSLPDSIETSYATYNSSWYEDDWEETFGDVMFICDYNLISPVVTIENGATDVVDVYVDFTGVEHFINPDKYYAVVCKSGDEADVTPSLFDGLDDHRYTTVNPNDEDPDDYHFHLKVGMLDIHGDSILPGTDYMVFIAVKYYSNKYSISNSSNYFRLGGTDAAENLSSGSSIQYLNNHLDIYTGEAGGQIEIFSVNGQRVMSRNLYSNHESIPIDLPSGIYFAVFRNGTSVGKLKFSVNN